MKLPRRNFLGLAALGMAMPKSFFALTRQTNNEINFYSGTYTSGKSEGIYLCRLNLQTGDLKLVDVTKGVSNPSFLALDGSKQFLFAVNEDETFEGKPGGAVSAFKIDSASGRLEFINQKPTRGASPCHLVVDQTNQNVLVANYSSGSTTVLPFHNGALGDPVSLVQHHGSSVDPDRQLGPHAHCVTLDTANRFAYVSDLGLDQIKIYKFNARSGALTPNVQEFARVKPGAGPRHFTIHPNQRWAYLINELDSTVNCFNFDQVTGGLTEFQNTPTLPANFSGKSFCAELAVAPSGRFLYGSNRGHDSITVFAINEDHGFITPIQHQPTGGKWPRHFAIDPSGRFLLVANQNTDNIFSFSIDEQTGKLTPTGRSLELPSPVCVLFS
ncbi:MAG TPA: lactonase family protein [Pyrinomonadaceae bacterium]